MEDLLPLKGSSEKCSVCLESNVELYFKQCGHTCVCVPCCYKLE